MQQYRKTETEVIRLSKSVNNWCTVRLFAPTLIQKRSVNLAKSFKGYLDYDHHPTDWNSGFFGRTQTSKSVTDLRYFPRNVTPKLKTRYLLHKNASIKICYRENAYQKLKKEFCCVSCFYISWHKTKRT